MIWRGSIGGKEKEKLEDGKRSQSGRSKLPYWATSLRGDPGP